MFQRHWRPDRGSVDHDVDPAKGLQNRWDDHFCGAGICQVARDNDRLSALPEIASQFRELKNARSGSLDGVIYSPFPIDAAGVGAVAPALEKRFGRKLNLTVQNDPSLIGGIRVVVGDEVLDTSVKARLEQMKVALTA